MDRDLFTAAYVPKWGEQLESLADLAMKEPWRFRNPAFPRKHADYIILEKYINGIFTAQVMAHQRATSQQEADARFFIRSGYCMELGALNQIASEIIRQYPTYTEVSPSGTGLHLFYRGVMTAKGNKNSDTGVEMYAHSRFFTMTGNRLENTPAEIADGTEALPWIHETYIAKQKPSRKAKTSKALRAYSLSDEQVLEKARSAQNAENFSSLWDGQWQDAYGSQSEADLALCCSLAFWTGKDPGQMDRMFRQSKLFREKWDTVHHADGATYGAETMLARGRHSVTLAGCRTRSPLWDGVCWKRR